MAVLKPPGGGIALPAMQNPSKSVADPHQKTPQRGAPGFVCPWPVFTVESDTLSGRARRGLDRALAVGGGLGGGGMHRVGACRGEAGAGPGVARVVSMTKTTEGRSGGGGVGARRSPAGRRGRLAQSVRVAGAACMHYTPPIPQGIRVWQPGDRRRAEAAPIVGTRLFRLRSTLHALWRAVWGHPQGCAGPVPVCQPCTVCRLFLGRERRQVFKPVDRSHHGYNPGESHLPPHS